MHKIQRQVLFRHVLPPGNFGSANIKFEIHTRIQKLDHWTITVLRLGFPKRPTTHFLSQLFGGFSLLFGERYIYHEFTTPMANGA